MGAELKIPIVFDAQGNASVSMAFQGIEDRASSMSSKVTAMSTAFLAVKEIVSLVTEGIKKLAEASLEYEGVTQKLKTSLEVMGQSATKGAISQIEEFASKMQLASGVSENLIMSMVATNVQMGMTQKQAESTAQAALGLAKAQGVDAVQANQELIQSLAGHARALKMVVPEVAAMNIVQLASGAAIDVVGQKFNKFITSDAATTQGSLNRLKTGFEDLTKTIGLDFFQGLDMPGNFGKTNSVLEILKKEIQDNKEVFVTLGQVGAWLMTSFFDVLIVAVKQLPDFIGNVVTAFEGLGDMIISLVKGAIDPFVKAIDYMILAYEKVKDVMTGGQNKDGVIGAQMALEEDTRKWFEDVDKFNAGTNKLMIGIGGAANQIISPNESAVSSVKESSGVVSPSSPERLGTLKRPELEQIQKERAAFDKQIQQQSVDIAASGTDPLIAEYTKRMNSLNQIQKDAAFKGLDYSKQVEQLKESLDEVYLRKFQEDEIAKRLEAAKSAGDTIEVIQRQYQQEVELFKDKLRMFQMSQEEYDAAVAESKRKASLASMQTTGSASTDDLMNKTSGFVGSIQGGISSIISQVGALFGPEGTMIAGIINMLNMTKSQFKAMIDGIVQAMIDLPKNLSTSIDYLIEKVPEIATAFFQSMFSVKFWEEAVQGLYTALVNMFKNFWAMLFGGSLSTAADTAAAAKKPSVSFGANDPNAGNSEFKIKNISLSQSRQATTFADTFTDTVQSVGKSFLDYLKDAWNQIITMLENWFGGLAKRIWDGLVAALNEGIQVFGVIGKQIWTTLSQYFMDGLDLFKNIGAAIWNTLKAYFDIKLLFGDPAKYFENLGKSIFTGFNTAFSGMGKIITDLFNNLNPANLFSKIFNVAGATGKGTVETALNIDVPFIKFAEGGLVPGSAPMSGDHEANDRVLAYLSPGEAVIPRSLMANPKIAGMIGEILNAPHYSWGSIGKAISSTVKGAGGAVSSATQGVINDASQGLKYIENLALGPLWALVWPAVQKSVMSMFEANHFSDGGIVGGSGFRDSVPAMLTPGERVLNRDETASYGKGGGSSVIINFNIAAGANFDKAAVSQAMPQIIDILKRESRNGKLVVRANGVY